MNPNYHYQPAPPLPPVPPYYPMMNNYGNNASATASPDSGIYCPQENPNLISDQHPPTPSLAVSPYYNHNEGYHAYPQYPHQYHNQQQIPNNNFPVYQNPAINFQPPIPGNNNAILEGNSSRNRNKTNSFVAQDGSMTGTTTTQGERLSMSDSNDGNTRHVKVVLGRVTSRDGDIGVIDEDIFLHISAVVKGTEIPKIGDNVLVKAEATRIPSYKWYAKEVQLVKIGLNQEDHQKNLPPVPPPAPKISKNTSSASEKSNSTKSRHKSDRDYSYNRRRRSSSRERPRSGRSSRNSRKRDSEVTKSSEPKKRKFHNDEDNSESISNEKTETFVKTNEELNISQNIHATTEETSAISSNPAEPQIESESEKSKDKEGSGSVEYANAVSENSEVGVDNCEKSVSSEQTPIQIPDGLANVENATENPTDTEQNLSAVSSPNTQVKHAFHGIQIKKEKVDPILPKNLVTPDKTLSPSASQTLTIDNTRIKREPPEKTPKSPNLNKYSIILSTSLPNNHPIILPVEIDKVKEEPLEDASTELDEDSPANDSFLVDKTPIYTGPSASTAIVNPIHRNNNIESVSLIPNSLYFGIPPVESEIQDQERDSDQRDEMPTEISDCLISRFVPFPDENVSASLNDENVDLSVESVSNEGKEISEEGNANSEGTDLGKYDIGISNTDEPEITNDQETLRKTSESHDHFESETEIAEPENQNCFTSTLCGRPVQTLSPAQVLLNRIRKVRSGVNVKPKIQREETTTRKDPTDKNEIVNESTTNHCINNLVANDPVTNGLVAPLVVEEIISDCLHVKSVELPMEDCLSIVNLPNANNPDNCINATDILDTPDEISNIGDTEKPGQISNPSTENNEQNLNCQESLATSNPIAPNSLVNPLAINLNEAQVKEFGEIVRTISAKSVSEPGAQGGKGPTKKSESPKQKQTFTAAEYANMKAKKKRPRVNGREPHDEYANQSGKFFYGTVGHGPPNYPNTGNGRWFDYYEAFMAEDDSRRFNPRVDFSFNGIDPTFNQPREPWVPPQQFIPPLMNNAPIRPGIGICQFCGEMGHHESVCRHRSSRVEFHSQEPPIMRVGDAPICLVCGKMGHETNVCWHHPRNAKSDFGVEPPPPSCSFCRIKGHDVSVCRNRVKKDKCKICKKIGHRESVCRSRFRV